jgi:hypothetical protein
LKFIDLLLRIQQNLILTHDPAGYQADPVMTRRLVTCTV